MPSYLQIENISKSYGTKVLFSHIGFHVNEGDKIALIAPNGTGKTTLMRILAGKDKSDSGGSVKFLKAIRIAFLEQDCAFDPAATVLAQALADSAHYMEGIDPFEYELRVRKYLTSFHLDPEQRMGALSGGEVKRVALTVMLASEADFLIMDEPTNHLDAASREVLEGALADYEGTLLCVSHDRYFVNRIANKVMYFSGTELKALDGNYDTYVSFLRGAVATEKTADAEKKPNAYQIRKEQERTERKRLSRISKIEQRLGEIEAEKNAASARLSAPETASDYELILELTEQLQTLETEASALETEWLELSE
jgi:ATPase subunit of ABC transporter with duplicated ATPase domains